MKEYQYPLDLDWTTEEMVIVTNLWSALEQANESGITVEKFLESYTAFKEIVKSIGEEKRLGNEFEKASGYSLYRTVQEARKRKNGKLKMGG
ncbi:UPF0223 family protein [Enterococcus sp. BWB1-3]|uniref:UPF0223 family protein n=1 Tax=unclassified Enterococcus TaxID=2608891 RepID=UPI001923BD65|nr:MULTISPECIES: UPF0223 family protein [unclassified Enterococcus]MBL1230476.1 UPF0223 family protein [Enterococcus sp. BWB1-3]MCB5955295.1 UPF0223 family protein [Enterococcus sp. CWB-B31]